MRTTPACLVLVDGKQLSPQTITSSRCSASNPVRHLASARAARSGVKTRSRAPLAIYAAAAPTDSATGSSPHSSRRRSGAFGEPQSSEPLLISGHDNSAHDPNGIQPPGGLLWREGATDVTLEASTSCGSQGSSPQQNGRLHQQHSSSHLNGAQRELTAERSQDESQAYLGLSRGCIPGVVVDLSASVSRWLEGGASLRDWLRTALHPPSHPPRSVGAEYRPIVTSGSSQDPTQDPNGSQERVRAAADAAAVGVEVEGGLPLSQLASGQREQQQQQQQQQQLEGQWHHGEAELEALSSSVVELGFMDAGSFLAPATADRQPTVSLPEGQGAVSATAVPLAEPQQGPQRGQLRQQARPQEQPQLPSDAAAVVDSSSSSSSTAGVGAATQPTDELPMQAAEGASGSARHSSQHLRNHDLRRMQLRRRAHTAAFTTSTGADASALSPSEPLSPTHHHVAHQHHASQGVPPTLHGADASQKSPEPQPQPLHAIANIRSTTGSANAQRHTTHVPTSASDAAAAAAAVAVPKSSERASASGGAGDHELKLAPRPIRRTPPSAAAAAADAKLSKGALAAAARAAAVSAVVQAHAGSTGAVAHSQPQRPPAPQKLTAALGYAENWRRVAELVGMVLVPVPAVAAAAATRGDDGVTAAAGVAHLGHGLPQRQQQPPHPPHPPQQQQQQQQQQQRMWTRVDPELDCIHVSAALVRLARLHRADPCALAVALPPAPRRRQPPPPPPPPGMVAEGRGGPSSGSGSGESEGHGHGGAPGAWRSRGRGAGTACRCGGGAAADAAAGCSCGASCGGGASDADRPPPPLHPPPPPPLGQYARELPVDPDPDPGSDPDPGGTHRRQPQLHQPLHHHHQQQQQQEEHSQPQPQPQSQRLVLVLHPGVARLLVSLLQRLPWLMARAGPRSVSNMLWALGVLQPLLAASLAPPPTAAPLPPPVRAAAAATARATIASARILAAKMRHFWGLAGPQPLAMTLWGMARLGLRPGPTWVAEFQDGSVGKLPLFSARQLSFSMWALAKLRLRPDAAWIAVARRVLVAVLTDRSGGGGGGGAFDARTVAMLLWACAVLDIRLDKSAAATVLSALTSRLRQERGSAGIQALTMAVWGCAKLGLRGPSREFMAAWREAVSGLTLAHAPARALTCMVWSLSELREAQPRAWMDQWMEALLARAAEAPASLGRQALCNALVGMSRLDPRVSPEWLLTFTAATAPLLEDLDSGELGSVLFSTGRLAVGIKSKGEAAGGGGAVPVAAAFLAAADAAAAAALPHAAVNDLAAICMGLRSLLGGVGVSKGCHAAVLRRVADFLNWGELTPSHATEVLAYLATVLCRTGDGGGASIVNGDVSGSIGGGGGGSGGCFGADPVQGTAVHPPLPPPRRAFVGALVRVIVRANLTTDDSYNVGQALCAAARLGYAPRLPAIGAEVTAAVVRAGGRHCSARGALWMLQGLYGMGLRPPAEWLTKLAVEISCRLSGLSATELDALLRLLHVLSEPQTEGEMPSAPDASAATTAAIAQAAEGPQQPDEEQQQQQQPTHSPVAVLLLAAKDSLASAPIQFLIDLGAALVAASTATATEAPAPSAAPYPEPGGSPQQRPPKPPPLTPRSLPHPPAIRHLEVPPFWLQAFEDATAPKLSFVSAAALVELLASLACLGHAPGALWVATWYECTARRLHSLPPQHLCMALQLQRRMGLAAPPAGWVRHCATALAAAAAALPPAEVLAAVAALQRFGLSDADGDGGGGNGGSDGDDSGSPPPSPQELLSGLVSSATMQLYEELAAADTVRQLAMLATLQSLADPWVTAVPQSEGWVVGVLAMTHAVIVRQPLQEVLAAVSALTSPPPSEPSSVPLAAVDVAASANGAAAGPAALVLLMSSLARWGFVPDSRWLAGVARYISGQAETLACTDGGGGGSGGSGGDWSAEAVARVVCCLAALQYVPAADVALRLQRQLLPYLTAAELPPPLAAELCTAWAAVRRPPPAKWWRAIESAGYRDALAEVPAETFVRLPYSMAQCGHVPSYEWLSTYVSYLPAALVALPEVYDSADTAAATAIASDGDDAAAIASDGRSSSNSGRDSKLSSSRSTYRAEGLANLVWALGMAVHEGKHSSAPLFSGGSGALQALLVVTHGSLGAMGPTQLVLLVEGLARIRHQLPPVWVEAFGEAVIRQLHACSPSDLVSILYCLAFLNARPPTTWLAAVLNRTAQLLPALLVSEQLSYRIHDLAWAVNILDSGSNGSGVPGQLSGPFLAMLVRQQAAVAAAAAEAEAAAVVAEATEAVEAAAESKAVEGARRGARGVYAKKLRKSRRLKKGSKVEPRDGASAGGTRVM